MVAHLPYNGKTSKRKNSVAIFCDIQNVHLSKDKAQLLLDFAQFQGRIDYKKLYYNSHYPGQLTSIKNLESLEIDCINVTDLSKNSADHRLMADCVKLFAPNRTTIPNIIILILGDWDYAGLIALLQAMKIKVIVFAQRGSASPKLMGLVGDSNFHFVDELPNLVNNQD
ncbi:NYN domain-containing protein [Aulosira sp. FACHB-615]|uniref:NYN domain-containing protein n=1 Tax=Aulosira sp. FACHB-615 TaxID=2692777 RepID=UPI0016876C76|nr:NYN domain-containing protein [Aulosira sp. FACHB-615]MBD2487363.1 NYN domain-containing protein [Aulosira sp. FACHB-615]